MEIEYHLIELIKHRQTRTFSSEMVNRLKLHFINSRIKYNVTFTKSGCYIIELL